jgi:uncharacterized protein (TIGR02466 family)
MKVEQQQVEIISLHSTPIIRTNIGRDFTKDEITCFQDIPLERQKQGQGIGGKGQSNHQSVSFTLFERCPSLSDVQKFCEDTLKIYLNEVDGVNTDLAGLKITQSWLNKNKPSEGHNCHTHSNSIISGVLYIKCLPNDCINLEKRTFKLYNNMEFPIKKSTFWNTSNFAQDVIEGDLILFPSWVPHWVSPNETKDKERISLAFNTFPVGEMGSYYSHLTL